MDAEDHRSEGRRVEAGDERLGLDRPITRRDFFNATLLGVGAALLHSPAPLFRGPGRGTRQESFHPWTGYGGMGDYAVSNGNTWEVMNAGHGLRDGAWDPPPAGVSDTGETFDLVVVGAGLSGLGAAHRFTSLTGGSRRCLVLDNHPLFGGEAKRNEFVVGGERLIGPQGSNACSVPDDPDAPASRIYHELGLPTEFEYVEPSGAGRDLEFPKDNYWFQLWYDRFESFGFHFGDGVGWKRNPWARDLEGTPYSPEARADLLRWRTDERRYHEGDDFRAWLDTLTYEEYLTDVMGLGPEVPAYVHPIVAAAIGLGADITSAYGAYELGLPGFRGFREPGRLATRSNRLSAIPPNRGNSFPGGNAALARALVKRVVPEAIEGSTSFEEVVNGRIVFSALDRPSSPVRLRPGATVVRVEHDPTQGEEAPVRVTYLVGERLHRTRARGVVMACGGWVAKHAVRDLPPAYGKAYERFTRAPMLVVNVALHDWRFLRRLGFTACRWFEGFGFCCNIRKPMAVGDYRPPLHPDRPALLTFYVPFSFPGLSLQEQTSKGRAELLGKSYRDYERIVRTQMLRLFGEAGFDPARDIAGIVLNRWGHAYVCPTPGFFFGRAGEPPPATVLREPFGRIAFANADLRGFQNWHGAILEGRRAAEQLLEAL